MESGVTRRRFVSVVAAGTVLAGCDTGGSGKTASKAAAGKPKRGGTLRVGLSGGGSTDTLSPLNQITVPDYARAPQLFDPLVGFDKNGRPEFVLAEEITSNADATEWTIRVKSGVTFHDGKDLTADDVKHLFETSVDPATGSGGAAHLATLDVGGIRKLDKHTLRVPFKQPYSTLVDTLADYFFYVIPVGFDAKKPVGTGPFKFESFTPGQESTFSANKNYWETGRPYVDSLVMTNYPDESSQVNALVSKQTDMVNLLSNASVSTVESNGGRVLVGRSGGFNPIVMNVQKAPFTDERVRLAMKLIVNRKEMLDQVFGGKGAIANDIPSIWDDMYDHDIPQHEQDLEQAKSLLKQAGQDGLRIELVTGDIAQGVVQTAQVFAQQAKGAGVDVKLRKVTAAELFGPNYLKWTFTQSYWVYNPYFPQVALADLDNSFYQETHYADPRYRKLYFQALATTDEAARREIAHEMQRIYWEGSGYIIPYFAPVIDAHAPNVNGVTEGSLGYSFNLFRFKDVWLA